MPEIKKTIFDHINNITQVQEPDYLETLTHEEYEEFNVYLIHRFLGYSNQLISVMSDLDRYIFKNNLTKEQFYKLLINIIPKGKYWLNFPKKDRSKDPPKWMAEALKSHYEFISIQEAYSYIDLLGKEITKHILALLGYQDSQIDEWK